MNVGSVSRLKAELKKVSTKQRAEKSQYYFKTGEGEYGAGDVFVGATMPQQRIIAKRFADLQLTDIQTLLNSVIHEERMIALLILTNQFSKADINYKKIMYEFYMQNTANINNWDLVDCSAPNIVGAYLWNTYMQKQSTQKIAIDTLSKLAHSKLIWDRRIAVLATFYFIKQGDVAESYVIAELLLHDPEDLIQKAVGWMLRESGKSVGNDVLEKLFLRKHYKTMPRTMLRYAIERFSEEKRQKYLRGEM